MECHSTQAGRPTDTLLPGQVSKLEDAVSCTSCLLLTACCTCETSRFAELNEPELKHCVILTGTELQPARALPLPWRICCTMWAQL